MILVHFDEALFVDGALPDSGLHAGRLPIDATSLLQWYGGSNGASGGSLFVLLPKWCAALDESPAAGLGNVSAIRYAKDRSLLLPQTHDGSDVWIINGTQWPLVDWGAARAASAARRRDCEVLLFAPAEPSVGTHYPESLQVDETGRVVGFSRHYADLPTSEDQRFRPASLLVCPAARARAVVTHLIAHGWGADSIAELWRRFHVRWSDLRGYPALRGSGFAMHRLSGQRRGPTNGNARTPSRPGAFSIPDSRLTIENSSIHNPQSPGQNGADRSTPEAGATKSLSGGRTYRFVKRTLDIVLSAIALIVLSPFLLVVAALVKRSSPGPALFGHKRQGLRGREFRCLKFRTMVDGAEAMQEQLRSDNEVDGPQFRIRRDPRLTRLGAKLRRYNIDELPQLINVLRGEMSLIGPRPSPDEENQFCPGWRRARLSVLPGISGLWQILRVRDRPESDFQQWIYYDLEYARHRSLWLDWQILVYTPVVMFAPRRIGRVAQRLERRGICIHSAWIRSTGRDAALT